MKLTNLAEFEIKMELLSIYCFCSTGLLYWLWLCFCVLANTETLSTLGMSAASLSLIQLSFPGTIKESFIMLLHNKVIIDKSGNST